MAVPTSRTPTLLPHFLNIVKNSKAFQSSCHYSSLENQLPYKNWTRRKNEVFASSQSRQLHDAVPENEYENLFRISVIEIDLKGNSENKYLRLETLVNELRATEKLKLDKILNEQSDDMYGWNNDQRRLERKSIKSKEYQKQKRSQLPLRDLRMFFRHINLGKDFVTDNIDLYSYFKVYYQ